MVYDIIEFSQFTGRRKRTEKKQICALFKSEASLLLHIVNEIGHIISAVGKHTVIRRFFPFVKDISVCISDAGDAGNHTGSVDFAKPALDAVTVKRAGRNLIGWLCAMNKRIKLLHQFFACMALFNVLHGKHLRETKLRDIYYNTSKRKMQERFHKNSNFQEKFLFEEQICHFQR